MLTQKYHNGMNVLHVCCSQGYTGHVNALIDAAGKHFEVEEYLDIVTGVEVTPNNEADQIQSNLKDNGAG